MYIILLWLNYLIALSHLDFIKCKLSGVKD